MSLAGDTLLTPSTRSGAMCLKSVFFLFLRQVIPLDSVGVMSKLSKNMNSTHQNALYQ